MATPIQTRRKRCTLKRCRVLFKSKAPNQRFCCLQHKNEYHFKSEDFGKLHDDVVRLVQREVIKLIPQISRKVFLLLETQPPPALISRIADQIIEPIRAQVLKSLNDRP